MLSVSWAWPPLVSAIFDTVPTVLPPIWTWSPLTIWLASWNTALTW